MCYGAIDLPREAVTLLQQLLNGTNGTSGVAGLSATQHTTYRGLLADAQHASPDRHTARNQL